MRVLFCHTFLKRLKKIGSVTKDDVLELLAKYPHTKDIIKIDDFNGNDVLKCYLLKRKVRALVLLAKVKEEYVPITVVKKETDKGKNISKETYIESFA
ncbi:MAG: hypothetical protein ACUZ8E_11315 [Candidatus Anammoxibacter sp.]